MAAILDVSSIVWYELLLGVGVLLAATGAILRKQAGVHAIQRWYARVQPAKYGPAWYRSKIEPTERQAALILWAIVIMGWFVGGLIIVGSMR